MKTLSQISNAALARLLQEAVAEQVPLHIIQCINRYAMTLSTERIPKNILRKEAFQYYKEQIDIAALRSERARRAAATRRNSPKGKKRTSPRNAVAALRGDKGAAVRRCYQPKLNVELPGAGDVCEADAAKSPAAERTDSTTLRSRL